MKYRKDILWIKGFFDAILLQDKVKKKQLKALVEKMEKLIQKIEEESNSDDSHINDLPY